MEGKVKLENNWQEDSGKQKESASVKLIGNIRDFADEMKDEEVAEVTWAACEAGEELLGGKCVQTFWNFLNWEKKDLHYLQEYLIKQSSK